MARILFLVPHPFEDAGFRYRVHQFIPYLNNSGHECVIWPFSTARLYCALRTPGNLFLKILHTLYCTARRLVEIADLSKFDLIVIQREVFPFLTPVLESWVLFRHPRVVFAFDDAIYSGQPHSRELNHPVLYQLRNAPRVEAVLRKSLHVIAGNRILAAFASRWNANVSVIPTVVDCDLYPYSLNGSRRPVTVGWVGSRSTVGYLRAIEPALRRLAKANPGRVRFRFTGFPEYQPDLPFCRSMPFRLDKELSDLAQLDIGLMPLPDTEWTRGKCAFKAIQYMATGAVTVASPVGITPDLIQHGRNGMLATSNPEWFDHLHKLVHDTQLRTHLSLAARQTVEQSYSLQTWGPQFAELLEQLLSSGPVPSWERERAA
jgi:glycosyltransferase involved in cell wall biosynthesis